MQARSALVDSLKDFDQWAGAILPFCRGKSVSPNAMAALSRANALSAGCIFCGRFFLAWGRIFLAESFHASGSVENFLLAGVERMAG